MWKRVEKALHERARVFVVLSRQRPPLGEEAGRPEPRPRQLVEITRVQVDDAGRRWRRRLEGDDVVAFRALKKLSPSVAQADLDPRIRGRPKIALEQRCGAHHRGKKLRAHTALQPWIPQQGPGRDARPQSDDERRARLAAVNDEG